MNESRREAIVGHLAVRFADAVGRGDHRIAEAWAEAAFTYAADQPVRVPDDDRPDDES